MPTLTAETTRIEGVTFVELLVEAERSHRIRVESRLDGPVWPPRQGGRPRDEWTDRGVECTVEAGRTPFGFATPGPPAEGAAVELVAAEPVEREGIPDGIGAWLQRVEERVETAEVLAAAEDLPEATAAVASAGGVDAVEELAIELARDRRVLSGLSFVPDGLRERVETVDVPVSTLARIAHGNSRHERERNTESVPLTPGGRDTCS